MRHQATQPPQQPVAAGVEKEAELVGLGFVTGGPISREVSLPRLDVVFGLAACAVQRLVKALGATAGKIGHDEPGVASLRTSLDTGDNALDPAPALGGVVELLETPLLAAGRERPRPSLAFAGAGF